MPSANYPIYNEIRYWKLSGVTILGARNGWKSDTLPQVHTLRLAGQAGVALDRATSWIGRWTARANSRRRTGQKHRKSALMRC